MLTDTKAMEKARALKREATTEKWNDHVRIVKESEGYLDGSAQVPDGLTAENYREGNGYRIVNMEPDLIARITAMLAGNIDVVMRATDGSAETLERMCKALFDEWKRLVYFSGVVFEWTYAGVAFSVGVARVWHDPAKVLHRGGFVGVDVPHTLSVRVSPYARDPYHPLLGSEYVLYSYLESRERLKAMYPKLARRIDTLRPYTEETFEVTGADTSEPDSWTPTDAMDDDRVRVWEVTYEALESVEVGEGGEGGEPVAEWRTFTIAGDPEDEQALVLESDSPCPYGLPNIVLFVYERSMSSAYGTGGVPYRVHDLQDSSNVIFSQIMKEVQTDSTLKGVLFERMGVLSDSDKQRVFDGQEKIITLDPKQKYMDDVRSDQLLFRFQDYDTDWGKKSQLMDMIMSSMRLVTGVHSSVIGDVDMEKRVSGIALHSNQQATLIAQEPPRQHLNAAACNLARLVWEALRYHWILPQRVALDDYTVVEVNTRLPVTEETTQLVEQLMQMPDPQLGETPMYPSAIHVPDGNGDEIVVPLGDLERVQEVLASGVEAEYSFNYLPLIELDIRLTIEGNERESAEERRNNMTWASTMPSETFSWETRVSEAMRGNPHWSVELERRRLFGESIAQTIATVNQKYGPEMAEQLTQAVQQMILQIEQGAQEQAGGESSGAQQAPVAPAQ